MSALPEEQEMSRAQLRWFRIAVLVIVLILAAVMTVWPASRLFMDPRYPGGMGDLRASIIGCLILSSPAIWFFLDSRKRSSEQVIGAGFGLCVIVAVSHLLVAGGNSTAAIAYVLLIPLQFLAIPIGYLAASWWMRD